MTEKRNVKTSTPRNTQIKDYAAEGNVAEIAVVEDHFSRGFPEFIKSGLLEKCVHSVAPHFGSRLHC